MSETLSAEERAEEKNFAAGFETATPPKKVTEAVETPKAEETPPATPDATPEPKPADFAITREQWDALVAENKNLDKRIKSTVDGVIGSVEERIVKKLQAATPPGMTVELPADVVAEMEKDFPELAGHVKSALTKALKGVRGTGAQAAAPDADAIEKIVRQRVQLAEAEALSDVHPDWRDIVGKPDQSDHPYRAWLLKQPESYQTLINETDSASVIARSIDKFKAETKAPKPEPKPNPAIAARRAVLKAAVQPKGDGGQPGSSAPTIEDAFAAGFTS